MRSPQAWTATLAMALPLLVACGRTPMSSAAGGATPAAADSGVAAATRAPPPVPAAAESGTYAGWYLQHAGGARFQPCGRDAQWAVGQGADLAARARDFGLLDDTPVYVRLRGDLHGGVLDVRSVEQFGSPTPVRDCAMTGVVIQ